MDEETRARLETQNEAHSRALGVFQTACAKAVDAYERHMGMTPQSWDELDLAGKRAARAQVLAILKVLIDWVEDEGGQSEWLRLAEAAGSAGGGVWGG